MRRAVLLCTIAVGLGPAGCGEGGEAPAAPPGWSRAAELPAPVTNNAVAAYEGSAGCLVYSALGLDASRSSEGITRRAVEWNPATGAMLELPPVPGPAGRLAASSVVVGGRLYVLGGYRVASDGSETTVAAVDVFDPETRTWSAAAPLPVPVDDAVAAAWRDRWIVVVSGWSNTGNVTSTQLYDAATDRWTAATPFPGVPVFGHAGAVVGDTLLVVDGVRAALTGFSLVNQAFVGTLDPAAPGEIGWRDLGPHPGEPRYRAAGGATPTGDILIHGGTRTPYNFDGLGYGDAVPAPPNPGSLRFAPRTSSFTELAIDKPTATKDHRSLARCGDAVYTLGGMVEGPAVTADVWRLRGVPGVTEASR